MSANSTFETIRKRQAVRRFSSKPVPDRILGEILDVVNRTPSGFNLQPWHFVIVRNADLKRLLHHIALGQDQVLEAQAVIVFVADTKCWSKPFQTILAESVQQGVMTERHAQHLRKTVSMVFRLGPFGITGFLKRIAGPLRRLSRPTPKMIVCREDIDHYMREQTMLAVSTFLIACESAGLVTSPVDTFDEERLKKLLNIPKHSAVPVIVPFGYPVEGDTIPFTLRTALPEKVSIDLFPNKLSALQARNKKEGPGDGN